MNIAVENVTEVANWFLHTKPMTHKKLQKLLYFCYGIYLVENNSSKDNIKNVLFNNTFEAWVHGPVEPLIFSIYKYNGINLLYKEELFTINFNEKVMSALNKTMDLYGNMDADILEEITHSHISWQNARKGLDSIIPSNNLLNDSDIYESFVNIIE